MKCFVLFLCLLGVSASSQACTQDTIDSIVSNINPLYTDEAGPQVDSTLRTLLMCDENIFYAGSRIGEKFNPLYTDSTEYMVRAILALRTSLPHELVYGLGMGMLRTVDLLYTDSTYSMMKGILSLGQTAPEYAKNFALELMKKQDSLYPDANQSLLKTVRYLQSFVVANPTPPDQGGSPIWAFRSNNAPCDGIRGPWGNYELCPRYYATVSDKYGNRLSLACKAENAGVEFRVTFGQDAWSKIRRTNIETLAFGTSSTLQSLGVPYLVDQASTLLAEEPVAYEVLNELRSANQLVVNVRSNSGEVNTRLNFSLKGSNLAIGQLLQVCR